MANTEIKKTLLLVRSAENAVRDALEHNELTSSERSELDDLRDELIDIDNYLLKCELATSLATLETQATRLDEISRRASRKLERLEEVTKYVDLAANGIAALAKAGRILLKAGIL